MHEPQSTMSKAELRKTHKPIMEKRRRARINHCLNEIKALILEAMNKDPARHSKLEKADILEMAVKHLQNTQRQQLALAMSADPTVLRKFKSGFNECSQEIDKYINSLEGVDPSMKQRISTHLHKCINGIEQLAHFNFPGLNNPFLTNASNLFGNKKVIAETVTIGDQNNNPRIQIPPGIQLIPSRLPSGELALLVPNSSNLPYFAQNSYPNRNSAFSPVHPQSNNESKPLSPPMSPIQIHEDKSPKAFKPVVKYHSDDHQVPQISSTGELKTIQFPINKNLTNPKKIVEPLCIITNQSERYKQAKLIEETAFYEENLPRSQNIKTNNLLTIADSTISQQNNSTTDNPKSESASTSKNLDTSDMWRPW